MLSSLTLPNLKWLLILGPLNNTLQMIVLGSHNLQLHPIESSPLYKFDYSFSVTKGRKLKDHKIVIH